MYKLDWRSWRSRVRHALLTDICSAGSTIKLHCCHCTCQVGVETISFFIINCLQYPSTLLSRGYLLVCQYNPPIDGPLGEIREWSQACQSSCLLSPAPKPSQILSWVSRSDHRGLLRPERGFQQDTTSLPRQRPCDCNINLLARQHLPRVDCTPSPAQRGGLLTNTSFHLPDWGWVVPCREKSLALTAVLWTTSRWGRCYPHHSSRHLLQPQMFVKAETCVSHQTTVCFPR